MVKLEEHLKEIKETQRQISKTNCDKRKKAAAEKAAAEKAAAEKAAAEKTNAYVWQLSNRELEIIESLNR